MYQLLWRDRDNATLRERQAVGLRSRAGKWAISSLRKNLYTSCCIDGWTSRATPVSTD